MAQIFATTDDAWRAAELLLACGEVQRAMLVRKANAWPAWIELCARVFVREADLASPIARQALAGKYSIPELGSGPAVEVLRERMRRVAELAAGACGLPRVQPPCNFEERLLFDAIAARAAETPSGNRELSTPQRLSIAPSLMMPVLLLLNSNSSSTTGAAPGVVANLVLRRIELQPGEATDDPLFAAAPASYLLQLDRDFVAALELASRLLLSRLRRPGAAGFRLVWDLTPRFAGEQWLYIGGASASAAFTLAALGLLCNDLPNHDTLRQHLPDIDWARAAITARLSNAAGVIGRVEGLGPKLAGLVRQNALGLLRLPEVFVATDQSEAQQFVAASHLCSDIDALAESVATETARARRYGVFPDVVAQLHRKDNAGSDPYADFVGREWLDKLVADAVHELWRRPLKGGLLIVECPPGYGKTAWALQRVERTLSEQVAPSAPGTWNGMLDGWAFASKLFGVGDDPATLTGDPETVIAQLAACTRYRMGIKSSSPSDQLRKQPAKTREQSAQRRLLHTLLAQCAEVASTRGQPVVVLLDGVDEVFDDIGTLFPPAWPSCVIMILVGRPVALRGTRLRETARLPVVRLSLQDADYAIARSRLMLDEKLRAAVIEGNHMLTLSQAVRDTIVHSSGVCGLKRFVDMRAAEIGGLLDLERYVDMRAAAIERERALILPQELREAIVVASRGLFFVACDLLREREDLLTDIMEWRDGTRSIPKGLRETALRQLHRLEDAVVGRGIPGEAALAVLAWVSISAMNWTVEEVRSQFDLCVELAEEDKRGPMELAWRELPECLHDSRTVRIVLERAGDLLARGLPTQHDRENLRFTHAFVRELVVELADECGWVGPLHAAWATLCMSQVAKVSWKTSSYGRKLLYRRIRTGGIVLGPGYKMWSYALLYGNEHRARATQWNVRYRGLFIPRHPVMHPEAECFYL